MPGRKESVLHEAHRTVHSERQKEYGHPRDNHGCTAAMVDVYLLRRHGPTRGPIDAHDIVIFNLLQKISREANAHSRDSAVDIAGYAENLELIREETP